MPEETSKKHYQICVARRNRYEILTYCDSNMFEELLLLKDDESKNIWKNYYKAIFDASCGRPVMYEGNPLVKQVELDKNFEDYDLGPYTFEEVVLNKTIRLLDHKSMCYKDKNFKYVFKGIHARKVFVKDADFLREYTVFDKIDSLSVLSEEGILKLKVTTCPFIKEVCNDDGSLTLYPYLGYLTRSRYNETFVPLFDTLVPDLREPLETILYDLSLKLTE